VPRSDKKQAVSSAVPVLNVSIEFLATTQICSGV